MRATFGCGTYGRTAAPPSLKLRRTGHEHEDEQEHEDHFVVGSAHPTLLGMVSSGDTILISWR